MEELKIGDVVIAKLEPDMAEAIKQTVTAFGPSVVCEIATQADKFDIPFSERGFSIPYKNSRQTIRLEILWKQ